jgi:hypothetical protein
MSQDLIRLRAALEVLQDQLQQASRPSRFKPPTDLSLVEIEIGCDEAGESPLTGEILDISADGMKVALSGAHPIAVNQICRIRAGNPDSTMYRLTGNVRWVDSHPLITVFGIQFEASS